MSYFGVEGIRGELGVSEVSPIESPPTTSHTFQHHKVLFYFRRVAGIPMSNYAPTIRPPGWGLEWTLGVENGTSQNVEPTFLFDLHAHYRPIWHRLTTIHNAADR